MSDNRTSDERLREAVEKWHKEPGKVEVIEPPPSKTRCDYGTEGCDRVGEHMVCVTYKPDPPASNELRDRTEEVAVIARITVEWLRGKLDATVAMETIAQALDAAAQRHADVATVSPDD